jgi:hypothetical protein
MDNNWAAENLSLIRTLMERSALYRRALTPIMFYVGTLGTTAGLVGAAAVPTTAFGFGLYWGIVGIAGMAGAFLLARRQAMKDAEPFWSAPTRHVAQALLPAFTLGALVAVLTVLAPGSRSASHWAPILPSVWMGLYGCALSRPDFSCGAAFACSAGSS